jgi:hypothetical protein
MATTTKRDELDAFYDRLQTLPALVKQLGLSIAEAQRSMDVNYIESLAAFTKIMSLINNNLAPDTLDVVNGAAAAVDSASKLPSGPEAAKAIIAAAKKSADVPPSPDADKILTAAGAVADAVTAATTAPDAAQLVAKKIASEFAKNAKAGGPSETQYLELFRAIAPSHYQFTETAIDVKADLRVASSSELTLGSAVGINAGIFSVAVNVSYLKRSASDSQASAALHCVINAIPADHTMMNDLFARAGAPINATFKADAAFKTVQEAMNELKLIPAAPALPVKPAPTPVPEKKPGE